MSRIVNLTVHRNTVERNRAKRRHKDLIEDAKYAARTIPGIVGYAVVAWDKEGQASISWDVRNGEEQIMPEKVRMLLAGSVHEGAFEKTED